MAASLLLLFLLSVAPSSAEIRTTNLNADSRSIIPIDDFGFTHSGALDLQLSHIALSPSSPDPELSQLGFFLTSGDAWFHVLQQMQDQEISCPLRSHLIKPLFPFNLLTNTTTFNISDPAQLTLVLANCLPNLSLSISIHSSMYNLDPRSGRRSYLSVGSTPLPRIYSFFFVAYLSLSVAWIAVLHRNRLSAFRIHYFMIALLILKALNLLCEAEDKSFVERTGTAHGWDNLFYFFSLLKGVSLFTLIVLIGTGWSFLKPYLQNREKKVLMVVIPLQFVANAAQVVLDEAGPYASDSAAYKQLFLLVDIVCCCAVLFPIVWSIRNLREAARSDGKAAVNLMKLTLFRQYYIVVISYIYFTRVVVYALETITSYRYLWTGVVAGEVVTLAFYVFTGYNFRPEVHNPYFVISEEEEEAALEALKADDEFEL